VFQRLRRATARRRGSVAIMATGAFLILIACAAIMIDLSLINLTRTELQSAADSAALAGVAKLATSDASAIAEAQIYSAKHTAGNKAVSLLTSDIELGAWDMSALAFSTGSATRSAVRVSARREASHPNGALGLFFAPIIGHTSQNVRGIATAAMVPVGTADVIPMSLRNNFSFGPVDPKIVAANPGKDGPSYPTHPSISSSTAFFNMGDQVTVAIFGQGEQSPVHLTLDFPNFGDESKVLKGEVAERTASVGDRFNVIGQGTGQGGLVGDIANRISTYTSTNAKRTVIMPVIKTLSNSRDGNGQLTGQVEIVDFVAVHLDAVVQTQVPKPSKPSDMITIQLVVGTIVKYLAPARGVRTSTSTALPNPSVYSIQLVQ